jgi:hypothetical protein
VLLPGSASTFTFKVHPKILGEQKLQGSNSKGRFSLSPTDGTIKGFENWLQIAEDSGELTVVLSNEIGEANRTQVFYVIRTNMLGAMESYELVIDFITFSFCNNHHELIKGQSIKQPIRLKCVPENVLTHVKASITDIGMLSKSGFRLLKSEDGNHEIQGTPTSAMDSQDHAVTLICHHFRLDLNLHLSSVGEWKPPHLAENASMQITEFSLNDMITQLTTDAGTIMLLKHRRS